MENKNKQAFNSTKVIRLVISLFIAIALWLYIDVALAPDVTKTFNDITVEFINEETTLADNGLMLLAGYDAKVDVKLKAPRSEMRKLTRENIRIVADTGSITSTGVKPLRWNIYYPDDVSSNMISIASSSAYTVTVTVGELYTKEVPIKCEVNGSVANGYFTGDLQIDPETLILKAERENLLNISYAKVTINLNEAKTTIIETVEYQLYDYNDVPVVNDAIRSNIHLIQVTLPVRTTKTVPLVVDLIGMGNTTDKVQYEVNPKEITLMGEADTLAGINNVVLDKIYVEDLIEYQTYNYHISAPLGTYIYGSPNEATVIVAVNGAIQNTITIYDVTPANLIEGLKATIKDSLDVTIWGVSSEIAFVGPINIVASADLSSITEPGEYTLPVSISILGFENVSVKGTYSIDVTVSERNIDTENEVEEGEVAIEGEEGRQETETTKDEVLVSQKQESSQKPADNSSDVEDNSPSKETNETHAKKVETLKH